MVRIHATFVHNTNTTDWLYSGYPSDAELSFKLCISSPMHAVLLTSELKAKVCGSVVDMWGGILYVT